MGSSKSFASEGEKIITSPSEVKNVDTPEPKIETETEGLVTVEEVLLGRVKFDDLSIEHQENIKELVSKINEFFKDYKWPKQLPKKVNDGFRRKQDAPKGGSATSWHYQGCAIDLDDDLSGVTWKYVWENRFKAKKLGLYFEHPCWTHHKNGTWMHIQTKPPKSGKRFFVPSSQPNPNPSFWDGKYEAELDKP